VGEPMRHFGKFETQHGGASGQHEIEAGRHKRLVATIDFAETALGPVAMNGIAHRGSGGDHTGSRRTGRGIRRTSPPCHEEGAAIHAASLLTYGAEIVIAPQTLPGAKSHFKRP